MSFVTGLFFLVLLLNQRWSPPFRLQASHCSTYRITCDVPSIAVFYSESIECLPGTDSKFFLRLLVTIPVAQIITGIFVHFRFHIRCISIYKLLYFKFFSASFCTTFLSAGTVTSISAHVFSFFVFNYYILPIWYISSLSVCTAWFHLLLLLLLLLLIIYICLQYHRRYFDQVKVWTIGVRFMAGAKKSCFLWNIHTGSGG